MRSSSLCNARLSVAAVCAAVAFWPASSGSGASLPRRSGSPAEQPATSWTCRSDSAAWQRYRNAFLSRESLAPAPGAAAPAAEAREYTWDWDFDEGVMVGVNHDYPHNHQLQLNETPSTFPFIWIALSGRNTIAKIDTVTGQVLGEYQSMPDGRGGNPSRTTVDLDGNVWVGNRAEGGTRAEGTSPGSIVRVGLLEAGQCVDRNGSGAIDTSSGLRDVLPWRNQGGADDGGGVSTALDECIIDYIRVPPAGVRTIAVDARNDVWVGGPSDHIHVKVESATGQVVDRHDAVCGGYGALVDGNGVLWSANSLLYLDPARNVARCLNTRGRYSYGLGIDTEGYVYNSSFSGDTVVRYSPSGHWSAEYPTGGASGDRGVAVTPADDNVWVANSAGADVSRLDENGDVVAVIPVGNTPTGVAVDQAGKVWVTNMGSDSASRIDPRLNAVDLTVPLGRGAQPYNYSDMTGMVARSFTTRRGTWLVVHDSGEADTLWGTITWTSAEPVGTSVSVRVRAAEAMADLGGAAWQLAANGTALSPINGRFLQVEAILATTINRVGPVLYDLTVWPGFAPTPSAPPPTPTATVTPTPMDTPVPTPTVAPGPVYLPLVLKESCPLVAEHADIALVIDASTSMLGLTRSGITKLAAARAAIQAFMDLIDMPGDRVAVVTFNSRPHVRQSLTGDREQVSDALGQVNVDLQTRTDLALLAAAAELSAHREERPDNKPVIVLLTDGLPNPVGHDTVEGVAERVKGQGIAVFAIGLGLDVNSDLLRRLATSPGHYYVSPDGDDLDALYRRIARALPCPGVVFWPAR